MTARARLVVAVAIAAVALAQVAHAACPTDPLTTVLGFRQDGADPKLDKSALNSAVGDALPDVSTYYRASLARATVARICSLAKGDKYKTYLPLYFPKSGRHRMIKPVAGNSNCNSASSKDAKLQLAFKLLDNAQVGVVVCPANGECDVHLDNSTAPGYMKSVFKKPATAATGRRLTQSTCDKLNCGQHGSDYYCECSQSGGDCGCSHSCFPADALVTTAGAGVKRMEELRIGDRVLAARPDGSTFFDEVYMFGHKDGAATARFIQLDTASRSALRLTPDHYLPVVRAGERLELPSSAVKAGDLVNVVGAAGASVVEAVVTISIINDRGLYNPYTLGGAIVVDGVTASCHSASALDGLFNKLGVPIPAGYQAVFAPVRAIYRALGPKRMASLHFIIDAVADVANTSAGVAQGLAPAAAGACALGAWGVWLRAQKRVV